MNELHNKIRALAKEKNAIILAHNYQRPEVQDVADFVGDSLDLSKKAATVKEDIIVFCGVHFMAETAKILAPNKTVLLPNLNAGCYMADMITRESLIEFKKKYPKAKVVCYINSSADVKAECDAICTSSNAIGVVERMDSDEIIFAPDKYLAAHVSAQLKARGSKKKIIPWYGFCPTHMKIIPNYLKALRNKYPKAKIITHPECTPDVNRLSDAVLSTNSMANFVKESNEKTFIVGTEIGIIHRLQKENPDKELIPATELATCPNMKSITIEDVYDALKYMQYEITVKEKVALKAKTALEKML